MCIDVYIVVWWGDCGVYEYKVWRKKVGDGGPGVEGSTILTKWAGACAITRRAITGSLAPGLVTFEG
jgi:hypothetical protein